MSFNQIQNVFFLHCRIMIKLSLNFILYFCHSYKIKAEQVHQRKLLSAKVAVVFLAVTNILPALYLSLIHQRGTLMVSRFLHKTAANNPGMDVLFLMPCHSTPYYRSELPCNSFIYQSPFIFRFN